jgi:hypothetical protein
VGYIGERNPENESDFQIIGAANQVSGWKTYNFSYANSSKNLNEVFVSIGISVRWEAAMTYFIDDVAVTLG